MLMHYALQKRNLNTNLAYKIGLEKASITDFEKVSIISIPINSNELFLIRTEPNVDHCKILNFVHSALDPKSMIREEIKKIQADLEELKRMGENEDRKTTQVKKKEVRKKPAKKDAAKKKEVRKKPAKNTVERKTARHE